MTENFSSDFKILLYMQEFKVYRVKIKSHSYMCICAYSHFFADKDESVCY